jgi:2-polyprenyl-3-methyl-5-hydroxy-6-metoxy-1,4-benzoquinol methylase
MCQKLGMLHLTGPLQSSPPHLLTSSLRNPLKPLNPSLLQMYGIVGKLCDLAEDRLILSFAPKNCFYSTLKKIGEFFPGPSKTTRAYLHPEEDVVKALKLKGFSVARKDMTSTNFYFSRLLEAVRD